MAGTCGRCRIWQTQINIMYRLLLILLSVVGITAVADARQRQEMNIESSKGKILIAYFSATGTTECAAEIIAGVTGGELYEIIPAQPYTGADLDWTVRESRSSVEMNDEESRPAIKGGKADISDYDVIFIGYPIWWDLAPRIINTFIESHEMQGKTLIPFATSGSSPIGGSVAALKKTYPKLNWKEGCLLNRSDEKAIRAWIEKTGL